MGSFRNHLYHGLFGLQFRATALLAGVVLLGTGLTGATYVRITEQLTLSQTKLHARDLAKSMAIAAGGAVPMEDHRRLLAIAEAAMSNADLAYMIFTDMTGRLLASHQRGAGAINDLFVNNSDRMTRTDGDDPSRQTSIAPDDESPATFISLDTIDQPRLISKARGGQTIDVVYPITAHFDEFPDAKTQPTVGYVRLGINLAGVQARLDSMVRSIIGLAVGIALLMVPLGFEIVRHVVGPINRLSDAAGAIAMGKLEARVPIERRDEIGALSRAFNRMADELSHSHHQLVKLNAELEDRVRQRTFALEKANQRLQEMAARDSLTGLYNRRHFSDLLSQLYAESTRYGTDLTCMMLDLDNFKRVNDSLGHQTGDQLLQLAARVIKGSIRESDVAVRYGGDEFAVLLPQTAPGDARASAERILSRFRADIIREMPVASIASLSIGLASRERSLPPCAQDLVNLSDEALYLAKAGGKNRITVVRPAVSQSHAAV